MSPQSPFPLSREKTKQGSKGQQSLGGVWGVPTIPFSPRSGEDKAGFQGTAVPRRGVGCPHNPLFSSVGRRQSRVPRDSSPFAGCGVSPQSPFLLGREKTS